MPQTVLVADDDRAIRESLTRALELEGYEVVGAADGVEVLTRVRRDPVDALVLDVMMPALDGIGVCRVLRADGDRTPVLMLTARVETPDRVAGLDAGADDYLPKPFELDELLARLRALLRRAAPVEGERAAVLAGGRRDRGGDRGGRRRRTERPGPPAVLGRAQDDGDAIQRLEPEAAVGRMFFQILGSIAELEARPHVRTDDGWPRRGPGPLPHRRIEAETWPRQVKLGQQMYDEVGEDGKRAYTVAQIAAESGFTRPIIYRHLDKNRGPCR